MINFPQRIFFNFYRRPHTIQIEVTNKCNLDCAMCPRPKFKLEYEDMDSRVFQSVLARLEPKTRVILTGWGEPLLHPDIFRFIALCKDKSLITGMTTNGTLITREKAGMLVESAIDSVSISVDHFGDYTDALRHNYPKIEENIKNLIEAKNKRKKPRVVLQPTLHKGKENGIFNVIKKAGELQIDEVNIVRLDGRYNDDLGIFSVEEEREIAKKVSALSAGLGIKVNMPPLIFSGTLKALFCKLFWFTGNNFCPKLYDYLYVTRDGKVTPCCSMPNLIIGDLLKNSLEEIWKGEGLKRFRNDQGNICGNCRMLTLDNNNGK